MNFLEPSFQWVEHVGLSEYLIHWPIGGHYHLIRSDQETSSFDFGGKGVVITPQFQELSDPWTGRLVQIVDQDSLLVAVTVPPLIVLLNVQGVRESIPD